MCDWHRPDPVIDFFFRRLHRRVSEKFTWLQQNVPALVRGDEDVLSHAAKLKGGGGEGGALHRTVGVFWGYSSPDILFHGPCVNKGASRAFKLHVSVCYCTTFELIMFTWVQTRDVLVMDAEVSVLCAHPQKFLDRACLSCVIHP